MPISIEEFEKLAKEKPARAKVSNEELLEFLEEQACSTKEVAVVLKRYLPPFSLPTIPHFSEKQKPRKLPWSSDRHCLLETQEAQRRRSGRGSLLWTNCLLGKGSRIRVKRFRFTKRLGGEIVG